MVYNSNKNMDQIVEFKKFREDAVIPKKRDEDAGYDLAIVDIDKCIVKSCDNGSRIETVMFDTGLGVKLPPFTFGMVVPRSSIYKIEHTLFIANGTGIIDSGYRGPIKIILTNMPGTPLTSALALPQTLFQLVIVPYVNANVRQVEEFTPDDTVRKTTGFGSTNT